MIELIGLTKRFDSFTAVDEATLSVAPGEILALLGPNGAGKTTTVRMLAAILRPTAGEARVAGYSVTEQPREVRRRVGVLTEHPGLYLRMEGGEYLDFYGRLMGLNADSAYGNLLERHAAEDSAGAGDVARSACPVAGRADFGDGPPQCQVGP
jgi:ABC-2 type transport system ATP-binding protein